ncbi:MAG TPA: sugar phosphate isomerase/epimerase family protein [Caldilineaceae bacterium]|mgnify:FL=1|nr:sugar phosphate isomerase/epimerase family protein [Caldilineaceae bacterium]
MSTIQLGVLTRLEEGPEEALQKVSDLGFPTCQLSTWRGNQLEEGVAARVRAAASQHQVAISTLWAGLPGRHVWDFLEGPTTLGLVPPETRAERLAVLKRSADFAKRLGVGSITTHVGFIPENPSDPAYPPVVAALREIAVYCAERGLQFWFETGQETPITLLRTIQDIGTDNLGINLDPANLLMYGKANPVDALDVFGRYVRGVHAKDGEYPTNGRQLGVEKPLGEGRVNFPALLAKLKALGFSGALTIEREISGPQQIADIKRGKQLLEDLLN